MDFPITEKEANKIRSAFRWLIQKIRLGETAVLSSGGAKRFDARRASMMWRSRPQIENSSGLSINHDRPITMEFQNSVSDRYFQSIRHRLSERVGLAWHLRLATGQKPLRHQAPKRRPCPHSNRISSYAVSDWRPSSPNGPQDLLDYKPL